MNEHLVSKIINLYVAYMDGAGGVPSVRRPDEGREHMSKDGR